MACFKNFMYYWFPLTLVMPYHLLTIHRPSCPPSAKMIKWVVILIGSPLWGENVYMSGWRETMQEHRSLLQLSKLAQKVNLKLGWETGNFYEYSIQQTAGLNMFCISNRKWRSFLPPRKEVVHSPLVVSHQRQHKLGVASSWFGEYHGCVTRNLYFSN